MVLACIRCRLRTTALEAAHRYFRTGRCAACNGELRPAEVS